MLRLSSSPKLKFTLKFKFTLFITSVNLNLKRTHLKLVIFVLHFFLLVSGPLTR